MSDSSFASVVAVVVHHRDAAATKACLDSLKQQDVPVRVVVVNTAYPDPEGSWPLVVGVAQETGRTVIEAGENVGFTGGSNLGMRFAMEEGAEFVWLVNPDAVAPPGALRALVGRMRADAKLGAVGSSLESEPPGGSVSLAAGSAKACFCSSYDFVSGASLLLRVAALKQVGVLDEKLFLYWEDVDLCLRLKAAGWTLAVEESSKVAHVGGGTVGKGSPIQDYYAARNAILVVRKHSPLLLPVAGVVVAGRITVGKVVRGEGKRLMAAWAGFVDGVLGRGGRRRG